MMLCMASCAQYSSAQGVATLESNKTEYEYGESIEISFTIENPSQTTFSLEGSSNCQAQFRFNDFDSGANTICLTDLIDVVFSPGGFRTWRWVIEPQKLGLPDTSGTHTIVGYYRPYSDTLQITAPKFIGGRLDVYVNAGASADTLDAIKSALNADVIWVFPRPDGSTQEEWRIEGVTVDDAIATYGNNPVFQLMEANRLVDTLTITSTQKEVPLRIELDSEVYPNPFQDSAKLRISGRYDERVQVTVYDLLGRQRMVLYEGYLTGVNEFAIGGASLPPGVYFYKIIGEHVSEQGRFVHIE